MVDMPKSCRFFLHNISKLWPFLPIHTAKILSQIQLHLDNCDKYPTGDITCNNSMLIYFQSGTAKIILLGWHFDQVTLLGIPPLPFSTASTINFLSSAQGPSQPHATYHLSFA